MLIEAARRAEAATKEMLARAKDGTASTSDLQRMLEITKSINAVNAAAQASAAAAIAERRNHGDGGAEVLASSAGLSRRDAHSHVKTAKTIEAAPAVRDAVESGRVSLANAKRLAEAVDKTSAQDVESDAELLAKAETMRPDQFTKEARRWTTDHQGDGGQTEHARQRSRRSLRMWNADDGMVHLHGEFDAVTGKRISNRLEAQARRMYDHDKKHKASSGDGDRRRTFRQCMADALDNLTANGTNIANINGNGSGSGRNDNGCSANRANRTDIGRTDDSNAANLASNGHGGNGNDGNGANLVGGNGSGGNLSNSSRTGNRNLGNGDNLASGNHNRGNGANLVGDHGSGGNGWGKPFADIAVVWHLNAETEKIVAEIAGGDRLPASVLEELMCNCAVTGLLYNTEGVPLWRGKTKRRATPGQTRALIAKYGGCFHCGAHPAMCQAHHIKPWWQGGPTDISNMVLTCWNCHQRIHHHGWQIRTRRGQHTLHPPGPPNHRPAPAPTANRLPLVRADSS